MIDYMVDVETTGLAPDRSNLLQLAAVQFDLDTKQIVEGRTFNASLAPSRWRHWDDDTRSWWSQQRRDVYEAITANQQPPAAVLNGFNQWVMQDGGMVEERRFWARNAHFDWSILRSYYADFELGLPFSHRNVRDIYTFCEGRYWPGEVPYVETIDPDGAHNAVVDCIVQIDLLFKTIGDRP